MNDPTTDERATKPIGDLRSTPSPPRRLERRTIARLRSLGLVRGGGRRHWLYAAAGLLLGLALSSLRAGPDPPGYVLLLEGGTTPAGPRSRARAREYAEWASRLRADGVSIAGARLLGGLRPIGAGGATLPDVRGYFLYDAETEERALELAESCPHLRYGGSVWLGRIERRDEP